MPFTNRIGSGSRRMFGFGIGIKPEAPTNLVVTPGNQQLSVAFTAPIILGTGIVSYTATASPGGATATGAISPLVITGLTNGTAYTVTVTATNPFGSSTSAPSSPATPATPPDTPSPPTPTRGDSQVSLTWTAPANGGSPITDYLIQYRYIDPITWETFSDTVSPATSAIVTSLANGTTYSFRIAARNAAGTSAYSSASTFVIPAGVPDTPAAPTPTAGNGQVSLAWTAPHTNGSAITDYLVYYSTVEAGSYTLFNDGVSTGLSATVTGLSNGTAYYFKIIAVNSVGNSALSPASVGATPFVPPPPPPPPCSCAPAPFPDNCTRVYPNTCDGTMTYQYFDCGCGQTCPGTGGYNGAYIDGSCGYVAPAGPPAEPPAPPPGGGGGCVPDPDKGITC